MRQILRVGPWLLVVAALALLVEAFGPGNALVLGAGWTVVFGAFRGIAMVATQRAWRLLFDGLLIVLCFLAAFEAGWYLMPAAVAFLLTDVWAPPSSQVAAISAQKLAVASGVAAAAVGFGTVAVIIWVPLYTSSTSTTAGTSEGGTATIFELFGSDTRINVGLAVALAALVSVAIGTVLVARSRLSGARLLIGGATGALLLLTALGVLIGGGGVFLLPSALLALTTYVLSSRLQSTAT